MPKMSRFGNTKMYPMLSGLPTSFWIGSMMKPTEFITRLEQARADFAERNLVS